MLAEVRQRYEAELDPLFAAARLWVDDIIDPVATRAIIDRGVTLAAHNPDIPPFKTGVLQV
jgi:acetyl-CoA carboxylase carboxyltransferase component